MMLLAGNPGKTWSGAVTRCHPDGGDEGPRRAAVAGAYRHWTDIDRGVGDGIGRRPAVAGEEAGVQLVRVLDRADRTVDLDALVAVRSLHHAAAAVRRHLEGTVLHEADLSWTAFEVLRVLWVHGPSQARAVAAEVGVSRATLSGVAATLERRGLLTRHPNPEDRRLAVLQPTAAGRHLVTDLFPAVAAQEAEAVGCLTPTERDALTQLLGRVRRSLPRPGSSVGAVAGAALTAGR